jgi:DNA-binding HxlR family transcriptional regulator
MRKTRYNPYAAACPTRQALDRIADKWTVLIVGLLEQRPHRFGELLKGIEGISQKMLTQTLRSLELDGLVNRRAKATVPVTVEYSLTSTGRTLAEPLEAIRRWAEQHIEHVLTARAIGERKRTATAATGQSRSG